MEAFEKDTPSQLVPEPKGVKRWFYAVKSKNYDVCASRTHTSADRCFSGRARNASPFRNIKPPPVDICQGKNGKGPSLRPWEAERRRSLPRNRGRPAVAGLVAIRISGARGGERARLSATLKATIPRSLPRPKIVLPASYITPLAPGGARQHADANLISNAAAIPPSDEFNMGTVRRTGVRCM
jgi:hypothetical protein